MRQILQNFLVCVLFSTCILTAQENHFKNEVWTLIDQDSLVSRAPQG